ncbi:hypothetical protein QYF61_015794 [Mycteria americana]|uniref:Reverse transcriptase domain-containing protein n=1 Tax=Mycteria americana TaxID=33587 RepID=A0AAN7P229_MYCAM|nr:hypothetical protein QYF61_015794 [Mycteria americana]
MGWGELFGGDTKRGHSRKSLINHGNWEKCPKNEKVTPIFQKSKKEDPGNYRPVSFTSIPGKVMEQLILETISRHMNNKKIKINQHGFTKGKSCLTSLINFYNKMTGLVDEGRAVNAVCLDFSKAFDTVSHKILLEKLLMYR